MKHCQQLMLAAVAFGLVAPLPAEANDFGMASITSTINNDSQHLDRDRFRAWQAQNQVTDLNRFTDLQPTSWAYQALNNLIERPGCVAPHPNGTFNSGQAVTRDQAAVLLNTCLHRVTETSDELQSLITALHQERTVLKDRVNGLQAKVSQLEATQFSTTTKLQADIFWSLGAAAFGNAGQDVNPNARNGSVYNSSAFGSTTFNYDLRLNLLTSFTGMDLLYTRLRSGNYNDTAFNGNPYNLMALDRAFAPGSGANVFILDRLYYRFPIGQEFTAIIGPRARNTEFLAISPSYYGETAEGLNVFSLYGAPGAYNKATGGTVGLIWKQSVKRGKPFFSLSTSYVAPHAESSSTSEGGLFANGSGASWLTQLGFQAQQFKATFAWRYGQCNNSRNYVNRRGTQAAVAAVPCSADWSSNNYNNSFAFALAWTPKRSGTWMPSISTGWGYTSYTYSNTPAPDFNAANTNVSTDTGISDALAVNNIAATQSWTVGLQWTNVLMKGNSAGVAVGQPSFVTNTRNGATPFDGNYAWEWWYQYHVTDNISFTTLFFYLSNPSSAGVNTVNNTVNTGANVFGGLLTARFKF